MRAQTLPLPPSLATPLTLEAAIERGVHDNLALHAARERQLAAAAAVDVARQRPNPEVRVEFERETPTQAYTLGLPLELGGKRRRRIALGTAGVEVSVAESDLAAVDLRAAIRRGYFDVAGADARLALLREVLALAARARDAAQQRFAAGGAPRLEVLQAELARAEAENQVTALVGAAAAARAQLRALLALPADAELALATPIDAGIVAAPGVSPANPDTAVDLAILASQIEEQRARVALASALQTPDLLPEATITRGAEPEFSTGWRVGVGVTVPLFTRHRAAVHVEEATLSALTLERDAALARRAGAIASARAMTDALGQQYSRYQSAIVPQAIEVERLAEDSYRLGRTGIAAFLQALQTTRDVRLRMLQTAADFQAALADLERAIGAPLP
ncbi:MAG: TolC family protein [Acidobacteriota bacterium]